MSSKPSLDNLSTTQKIESAAQYVLELLNARSNESAQFGNIVFDKAVIDFPSEGFVKNTFLQYLSVISKKEDSLINCQGKRKGYYLSEAAKTIYEASQQLSQSYEAAALTAESTGAPATLPMQREAVKVQKELLLYPVLLEWLMERRYRAKNISNNRGLGKWGNPDVAGIKSLDIFNGISIEIVTIEAKVTKDGWEQLIFEAISHRRFANRAYFAFAHPLELFDKLPLDEMRYYAELFNVGILVIQLDTSVFNELINGELTLLDPSTVDIVELNSAPYQLVQPKYQLDFCKAQSIDSLQTLHRWGSELVQDT
jgi:hypothetical protein